MGPTFCPEMPVTYYQSTLRKILENRIQQQQETVFSTDRGLVLELGTCHCKPRGITALFSRTSCINEESARFEHCWSSACLLLQPGRIVCQYNTESSIGLATCNYMQAGVRRHLILEETMERSWHSTYTGPPPPHGDDSKVLSHCWQCWLASVGHLVTLFTTVPILSPSTPVSLRFRWVCLFLLCLYLPMTLLSCSFSTDTV